LTFSNGIRRAVDCHEDRDGCTAVLATTLAMAPSHRFRLTGSDEAHRAAQAATLKLIAHGTEPPSKLFIAKTTSRGRQERASPFTLGFIASRNYSVPSPLRTLSRCLRRSASMSRFPRMLSS